MARKISRFQLNNRLKVTFNDASISGTEYYSKLVTCLISCKSNRAASGLSNTLIYSVTEFFVQILVNFNFLRYCKLRWLNAVPKRTLDLKWEPLWQSLLLSKSFPLCCSPYSSSPYVISFHI